MVLSEWLRRSGLDYEEEVYDFCAKCTKQRCKECSGSYSPPRKTPIGWIPK